METSNAIKIFCDKLDKNAAELYEILRTVYGLTCISRASVLHSYKSFNDGREEVRDDERCGIGVWDWDVIPSELGKKFRAFSRSRSLCIYNDNKQRFRSSCGNCTQNYS